LKAKKAEKVKNKPPASPSNIPKKPKLNDVLYAINLTSVSYVALKRQILSISRAFKRFATSRE